MKINEIDEKTKAALKLSGYDFNIGNKFDNLKNDIKNGCDTSNILNILISFNKEIDKFNKKFFNVSGDYDIESTVRIYNQLKQKVYYAIQRTKTNDFSWAYIE